MEKPGIIKNADLLKIDFKNWFSLAEQRWHEKVYAKRLEALHFRFASWEKKKKTLMFL